MARRSGRSIGDVAKYTSARPPSFDREPQDDTVTSGTTFGLIAFVIFAVICVMAIRSGTANIESDLERRSSQALLAAGYDSVNADATGTSVLLTGQYTDDLDGELPFQIVASLAGVGGVDGQIWPVSTSELGDAKIYADALDIQWANRRATVTGSLSTQEKVDLVLATLDEAFVHVDADELKVKEGVADESPWLGTVLGLVQSVAPQLEEGRIVGDGENQLLVLSGEVTDGDLKDELNGKVTDTALILGFAPTPGVIVPRTGPTKEEVDELQEDLNELILDQVVEFETKSYALTEKGKALLDEVLAALDAAPEIRVLIAGHTDNTGSADANQLLSEQRANAVLEYLVEHGQDPARFDTIGYGETRPIASNDTAEGRARNRRIEFTALLEEGESG